MQFRLGLCSEEVSLGKRSALSVYKWNQHPNTPLVVRVFRKPFDEPSFFTSGLDLKKEQKNCGIDECEPTVNSEGPTVGEDDTAAVHGMSDDSVGPGLNQSSLLPGIGQRSEIGAEPEQSGKKQAASGDH